MSVQAKYIPDLLSQRYEKMEELRQAEDLKISLQENNIAFEEEIALVDNRIRMLKTYLDETLPAAEEILYTIDYDIQALNYARLHFLKGYSWVDISFCLKLNEKMIKSRVYRAFQRVNRSNGSNTETEGRKNGKTQ